MSTSVLYGIICALIAGEQDRNMLWGFICGLIFGIVAVIIYLIIGRKD